MREIVTRKKSDDPHNQQESSLFQQWYSSMESLAQQELMDEAGIEAHP
jgi:hypothetical protein